MLVDEHNGNVLALLGEGVERLLDLGGFRFGVDDEEVALGRGRVGDVLDTQSVSTLGFAGEGSKRASYAHAGKEEAGH